MIILIAAVAENNALGKDNKIIWHLPNDFKRFKAITSGHYIIMGRKTFESFPKPLPNRTHIVISRQKNYAPEGCIVVHSLEQAIALAPKDHNVYIIGGGQIYDLAMDNADSLEITRVHSTFEADAFFPSIDFSKWKLSFEEFHLSDENHKFDYTFQTYIRRA